MTIHTVDLLTRDGERVIFSCADTETLVAGAANAGLVLPVLCREGGCGTCRATCRDGDYHLGDHSAGALPAAARENRDVLLCRTFPRSDLTVVAPFGRADIRNGAPPEREAEILALTPVAERTVRLLLRLLPDAEGGIAAEFEPGQYMELEIPGTGIRRAYSLANTANWDGHLEFLIRLQPDGRFSRHLEHEARPGGTLSVHGPQGTFRPVENGVRPRWFVAGGTGLAPLLAMLRRMAEWQEPQPARLYFGVARAGQLFALDVLEQLGAALPGFTVVPCVLYPDAGWTGFEGSPVEALRRDLAAATSAPDLYLCGPPAMIDAAEDVARKAGLPAGHVQCERFLPGVTPPAAPRG